MSDNSPSTLPNPGLAGLVGDLNDDLIDILRRWWRVVAVSVLVSLTLALIYLAKTKRMYQASTKLLIVHRGGKPLSIATNDPQYIEKTDDILATHIQVIQSPRVVGRAIESIGLDSLPSLQGARRPVQKAIEELTVTRPDRTAQILRVDYLAGSRGEAVDFVKALTHEYQDWCLDTYQKNNSEIVSLIKKARDLLEGELGETERRYEEFRVAHPNEVRAADEKGHTFVLRRLDLWQHSADEGELKELTLKAQLELGGKLAQSGTEMWAIAHALNQLGELGGDITSGTMVAQAWGTEQTMASDYVHGLRTKEQQLAARFGNPNYSKIRALGKQITQLQERDRNLLGHDQHDTRDLLRSIEASIKAVRELRTEMGQRFNADLQWAKKNERILLTDARLRRAMDRQQTLFDTVVKQLSQAELTSDFSTVKSQVIDPSTALDHAVRPRVALTLMLALVAGCFVGTAGAVVADRRDKRYRTVDELRRSLGLTVIGDIPQLSETQVAAVDGPLGLVSHKMPRSPMAEAYRAVRTNMEFLRRNRRVQVILITSPQSGDGKSMVASNLAISLAHAGRKVLLVDADLRRPTQAKIHGLAPDRGLVHILRDLLPFDRVVQRTAIENVDLIASGPEVPNPAELLGAAYLSDFLEEARHHYDSVIIDAPPLLAVTDAAIMGAEVDGVLLVVRLSATTRPDAERAVELLKTLGAPILGTLVNGVDGRAGGYGYGTYGYTPSEADSTAPAEPSGDHPENLGNGQKLSSNSSEARP